MQQRIGDILFLCAVISSHKPLRRQSDAADALVATVGHVCTELGGRHRHDHNIALLLCAVERAHHSLAATKDGVDRVQTAACDEQHTGRSACDAVRRVSEIIIEDPNRLDLA